MFTEAINLSVLTTLKEREVSKSQVVLIKKEDMSDGITSVTHNTKGGVFVILIRRAEIKLKE